MDPVIEEIGRAQDALFDAEHEAAEAGAEETVALLRRQHDELTREIARLRKQAAEAA